MEAGVFKTHDIYHTGEKEFCQLFYDLIFQNNKKRNLKRFIKKNELEGMEKTMRKGKMTKIGMMLFIFMLSTSCGNVPEQLQTEQETVLSTEASLDEKEISKIKEWGKILYEYSSKEDSAIYSKGNSAVVTVNQWEQYVKFYLLEEETEENAKNLATKEAEEYEALYSNAIAYGYTVSEEEINRYLENLKQTIQEAKNKEIVTAIMEAFPSEQEYWNYQRTISQKDIPIQKYVEAERETYEQTQNTDWNSYFETWKEKLRQDQNFQKE